MIDPTTNARNLPAIPYPRWSEAIPDATPDSIRQEEENYAEFTRWSRDMLKRRWPGSGGVGRVGVSVGGTAGGGPIAPGGTVGPITLYTPSDYAAPWNDGATRVAMVKFNCKIQPVTLPLGVIDCDIVLGGSVYPYIMGASAAGDIYQFNVVEFVNITSTSTVAVTFNVYPPSLQAVTFVYAASIYV